MKTTLFTLITFFTLSLSYSQELNCKVTVRAPTLQQSPENIQLLEAVQTAIFNLMNNTKWTQETYQEHEKIECNLLITINSIQSQKNYTGTILVSSSRPVYNSNYNSPLVNTLDKKFNFFYQLNSPLVYRKAAFSDNLSGMLSFYAYYIIGMDHDSFALEGGTPFFIKAQEISNLAQSSGGEGWDSKDRNNRYWIVENVLNAQFKKMRQSVYEYHRLGMDNAFTDQKKALADMTKAISYLQDVHARQPGSINMRIYFAAKADEVVNIFSSAEPQQKNTVFNLVRRVDPGNIAKYQKIIKR